jgi:hypothetical protein
MSRPAGIPGDASQHNERITMKIVVIGGTGPIGAHLSDSEPIPGTDAIRFGTRFEDWLHA